MIYPMSAEAAEIARDQFTGPDPELFYQQALDNLEDKARRDPLKTLFPYLENDVHDLARWAIAASQGYDRISEIAKERVHDMCSRALRQYQDANVDQEIARLVEKERQEAA